MRKPVRMPTLRTAAKAFFGPKADVVCIPLRSPREWMCFVDADRGWFHCTAASRTAAIDGCAQQFQRAIAASLQVFRGAL